ncbi:MAG: ABC transporter permease [Beijerinckiaceae bacterium]|nr:ABC transporter permease [Beijerinckiaceae bacterium]
MNPHPKDLQRQARVIERQRGLREASAVQLRVVSALMIREALTRYGHENLGFFWIMGEPLVLTVAVMFMVSMTGSGHSQQLGIIPFVLTGYSMLTLWRHCVFRSIHAMRHNVGLLFHRNVRYLDILISRIALESLGGLAAFFVAYVPLALLGVFEPMDDPLLLLGAWFLMTWYGFGFGLILAGITEIWEATERFVSPLMYISIPITGAFFMVNWLPDTAQKLVQWSVLVHLFEMFRAGFFGAKVTTYWDLGFIVAHCLTVTAIGLPLVRRAQQRVSMG